MRHRNRVFDSAFRQVCSDALDDVNALEVVKDVIQGKLTRVDPETGDRVLVTIDSKSEIAFQRVRLDAIKWLAGYAYGTPMSADQIATGEQQQAFPELTPAEAVRLLKARLPQLARMAGIETGQDFERFLAGADAKMIVGGK